MSKNLSLLALLILPLAVRAAAQEPAPAVAEIQSAELGGARNVHRCGELWFSGQFEPGDVGELDKSGIRRVITLREDGEIQWDEKALVEAAGLEFVPLGFRAPETLTDELFDKLRELLRAESGPTLLHCGSANRVGGAWIPFRVLDQGVALEQALSEARTIGLSTAGYEERAIAYIERQQAGGTGIKPGINDNFRDPELDVESFIQRFEVESREVYSARHAVLAALGIKPGMRVADVGAGTGLYTFLIADATGPEGWVYAVDIAPRFLQHILGLAAERQVANVSAILCPETTTGLPPAAVDLAYICDTYHHFEHPSSTMSSILHALEPGGRLVVVEFDRIPGVSREWLLDHVRAGKEVFRAEIEQVGFEFLREIEVEGLAENYVLEFRKPLSH